MRGELDDGVFSTEGESLEGISDAFTAGDEDLTEPSVHDEAITASFLGTAEEPGETAVEDAVSAPSPFRGAADSNAAPAPGDPRPQGGTMSSPTAAPSGDDPWLENGAEPADSPSVGSLPPSRTARSAGNGVRHAPPYLAEIKVIIHVVQSFEFMYSMILHLAVW